MNRERIEKDEQAEDNDIVSQPETQPEALGVNEVVLYVRGPRGEEQYRFVASIENDGIFLATGYTESEEQPAESRDEDAWAAMDDALGFNAREVAVDKGIGTTHPPLSGSQSVSFVVLPYDMAILVRRAFGKR